MRDPAVPDFIEEKQWNLLRFYGEEVKKDKAGITKDREYFETLPGK